MATDVEKVHHPAANSGMKHDHNNDDSFIGTLKAAPGYANDRAGETAKELVEDEDSDPNIHHHVRFGLTQGQRNNVLTGALRRCYGPSSTR